MDHNTFNKDLYEILGVPKNASEGDIRKAFHKHAKKYHPDVNPGNKAAEQKFKEINLAYEVLKDSGKRAQYDQARAAGANPFAQGGFGRGRHAGAPGGFGAEGFADFGLGDLFEEIFGGGRGRRGRGGPFGEGMRGGFRGRGSDLETEVEVPFLEAVRGGEVGLHLPQGKVLTVRIPPGVQTGSRIKLSGQGEPGIQGGPPGDLILVVKILSHETFERQGNDILVRLPILFSEAVLGGEASVPTIDGPVRLRIPPGVSSGQRLKLSGKGVVTPSGRGDQFVELQIRVPKTPDKIYEQAAELLRQSDFSVR